MSEPTQEQIDAVFAELGIAFPLRNEITIAKALVEARVTLAAATQRWEALLVVNGDLASDNERLDAEGEALRKLAKAECDSNDALRKDAARLDAIESGEVHIECMGMTLRHMNVYSKHGKCVTSGLFGTQLSLTLRQAIDAAMAVQPTTEVGNE